MQTAVHTRVYIVYDGICNSVFDSQVLLYLHNTRTQYNHTHIVTFERNPKDPTIVKKIAHLQSQYSVTVYKRYPFIHPLQLLVHSYKLKKFLKKLKKYTLIARGPLAGYIAQKAVTPLCSHITIQARGLLAQEYMYAQSTSSQQNPPHPLTLRRLAKSFRRVRRSLLGQQSFSEEGGEDERVSCKRKKIRFHLFHDLEKKVYTHKKSCIEAVSPALQDYLVEHFGADIKRCSIARYDIPKKIPEKRRLSWRHHIREKLHFDENAHVYCYNGSAKPWQCPQETIDYCIQQYKQDPTSRLLVLTQDTNIFTQLLKYSALPEHAYRVISVAHKDIYKYLCACDTGLLFRKKHVVNWTSRPTKALEYQSAKINIIHNGTIAYLSTKNP